jgi:hypothetical protein
MNQSLMMNICGYKTQFILEVVMAWTSLDARTHKHKTGILTIIWSSVPAGCTKVLWPLSMILQSISKISAEKQILYFCRPLVTLIFLHKTSELIIETIYF